MTTQRAATSNFCKLCDQCDHGQNTALFVVVERNRWKKSTREASSSLSFTVRPVGILRGGLVVALFKTNNAVKFTMRRNPTADWYWQKASTTDRWNGTRPIIRVESAKTGRDQSIRILHSLPLSVMTELSSMALVLSKIVSLIFCSPNKSGFDVSGLPLQNRLFIDWTNWDTRTINLGHWRYPGLIIWINSTSFFTKLKNLSALKWYFGN